MKLEKALTHVDWGKRHASFELALTSIGLALPLWITAPLIAAVISAYGCAVLFATIGKLLGQRFLSR